MDRPCGITLDFFSKLHNPVIHSSCCRVVTIAPNVVQQGVWRDWHLRVYHKVVQSSKLQWGCFDPLPASAQFHLSKVHHHVSEKENVRQRLVAVDATGVLNQSPRDREDFSAQVFYRWIKIITVQATERLLGARFAGESNSDSHWEAKESAGGKQRNRFPLTLVVAFRR